jgi:hypothetical protein
MKRIALISTVFVIAGCAPLPTITTRAAVQAFTIAKPQDTASQQIELEKKFNEMLNFCQQKLSGYEIKAEKGATNAYWLSMSGLIAGSVIAPALAAGNAAANAVAIAAVSGWSGATNFASENLRTSGLSGSAVAQTRNNIITSVRNQIVIASDTKKDFDARRDAVMMAFADCVVYEIAVPTISSGN